MSKYENINVEDPEQIAIGEWTCKITWSGDSCRGSESIRKHRSTHFEAKRDAEVIANRLRSRNKTAVTKGDMPTLPPPKMADGLRVTVKTDTGDDDQNRDQASQAETNEAHAEAYFGNPTFMDERKEEELQAIAKALGCERCDILERIVNLKEQLAKGSKEANHHAVLAGGRLDEITKKNQEIDRIAEALGTDFRGVIGTAQAMREEARLCLETLAKAGIEAATPLQGARMVVEKINELRQNTERPCDHFIRSMGVNPTGDRQADLSECLAKYTKANMDLDAAIKNYRNAIANWSEAKSVADTEEKVMRHMARALAELCGATTSDDD